MCEERCWKHVCEHARLCAGALRCGEEQAPNPIACAHARAARDCDMATQCTCSWVVLQRRVGCVTGTRTARVLLIMRLVACGHARAAVCPCRAGGSQVLGRLSAVALSRDGLRNWTTCNIQIKGMSDCLGCS